MPELTHHIGVRDGALQVDVEITASAPDGTQALDWVEDLEAAATDAIETKQEDEDG
jgi:hypothetical protein